MLPGAAAGRVRTRPAWWAAPPASVPMRAPCPAIRPTRRAPPALPGGDVAARLRLRPMEIGGEPGPAASWLRDAAAGPGRPVAADRQRRRAGRGGSPRGAVWHWLRLDGGTIAAAFAADPSWRLWPVQEAASVGAAAADLDADRPLLRLRPLRRRPVTRRPTRRRPPCRGRGRRWPPGWKRPPSAGSAAAWRCSTCRPAAAAAASASWPRWTAPSTPCERFGLAFVATPRHADVLVATGPLTANMRERWRRPSPRCRSRNG